VASNAPAVLPIPLADDAAAREACRSRYFLSDDLPDLLRETACASRPCTVADLGAGDGAILFPLDRAGLVEETVYAVDISAERVALCETLSPKVRGVVADVGNVEALADGCADAVTCSMVIEHLPDDRVLAPEIARLLAPGGWFYVSSVIRGPRAFWIYRGHGRWQLDPTHVREYASERHFADALRHSDLELTTLQSRPLTAPLTDPAVRIAAAAGLVRPEAIPTFYLDRPLMSRARRALPVRIPGYRWVEAVGRRR
jgi:SAM-dependent methyltransferase